MKTIIPFIMSVFIVCTTLSCGRQSSTPSNNRLNNKGLTHSFDFSEFYQEKADGLIYYAHHKVPLGKMVTIKDLDNLFGTLFLCDTVKLTHDNGVSNLYEQESRVAYSLPDNKGDTLVMMRRIYGKKRDWMIWVNLEITYTDSLRVLDFLAYDNNRVDI